MNSNGQDKMPATDEPNQALFNMLTQYVKDLSFENPNAPASLQSPGENPNIEVGVNVGGSKLDGQNFEVILNISVSAKSKDTSIYEIELAYAGLFQMVNIPDEAMEPLLLIKCPDLIFPFVRRLIVDLTREGGFPPLMLNPFDFESLYVNNKEQLEETAAADDSDI